MFAGPLRPHRPDERLNDPDATTTDLSRSQLHKPDRQNRAEELAAIRREERIIHRQQQPGY